jgi:hypothetical protein
MTNGVDLPKEFSEEAVLRAAYLKNKSLHASLKENITPHEKWSGNKPTVKPTRFFV